MLLCLAITVQKRTGSLFDINIKLQGSFVFAAPCVILEVCVVFMNRSCITLIS